LEYTVGTLEIEKESFQKARIFSWVFFPTWIFLAIVQSICFVMSNGKLHPLVKIIKEQEDVNEGTYSLSSYLNI
jgi:hypothetical protein